MNFICPAWTNALDVAQALAGRNPDHINMRLLRDRILAAGVSVDPLEFRFTGIS